MDELKEEHKKKFGVYPVEIGINWKTPEVVFIGILDAIEKGVPYDEYEMLSDEDKVMFDDGRLFF